MNRLHRLSSEINYHNELPINYLVRRHRARLGELRQWHAHDAGHQHQHPQQLQAEGEHGSVRDGRWVVRARWVGSAYNTAKSKKINYSDNRSINNHLEIGLRVALALLLKGLLHVPRRHHALALAHRVVVPDEGDGGK